MKNKLLLIIIISIMTILALTSCGGDASSNGMKVVFTTGFTDNDVFRINDVLCTVPEFMVYLTTVQNKYEKVYGEQIWDISSGSDSLEEGVKENVLANISLIKSLYIYALDAGIKPTDEETQQIEKAAETYVSSLNFSEKTLMNVDIDIIKQLYTEYFYATKVYEVIVADINPEISDDEARSVTVAPIFLKTYTYNGAGERVEYTPAMKANVYDRAERIKSLLKSGEDFSLVQASYSDEKVDTITFMRGEKDKAYENAAFNLGRGEISDIVQFKDGFVIMKCISTSDAAKTAINKEIILSNARSEAFDSKYNSFSENLVKQINRKVYDNITLIHDENVKNADFFEVYKKFIY